MSGHGKTPAFFFFFNKFIYLFIYLWLHLVFVTVRGPSPVAASGGPLHCSAGVIIAVASPVVAEHGLQVRGPQ